MKIVLACFALACLILINGLTGCATPATTASQGAYQGTAAFVAALKAANTYAALPRCSVTVTAACSKQATVNTIVDKANKANIAVIAAQAIANDANAPTTDQQKAVAAANDAVAALNQEVKTPQ